MDKVKLIRGDFRWENNIPNSKVIFVPSDKGRFLTGYNPPIK
jgi:hypothetical protein